MPPVPLPAQVLDGRLPPPRRRGGRTFRVLGTAFLVLVLALLGLVLAVLVESQTGVLGFALGVALALVPVPLVVAAFMWVDRHEPEPPGLLLFAFGWGAVVAALASVFVNSASMAAIARASAGGAGLEVTAVAVAPFVEEATKGLGVLVILLARRREFDGVVDGVVCAGLVGLGFAFTENVLYYGRAYLEADTAAPGSGVLAAGATFVLRGVLSPFAHPLFTSLTGVGLGLAAHAWTARRRIGAPVLGYLLAVALHAGWNLQAVSGVNGFLGGYLVLMVPLFVAAVLLAAWVSGRERRAIQRALPEYARAGWLPAYDVAMASTPATRRRARRWAEETQGPGARRAMAAYQDAALELGLLRDRAEQGLRVPGFAERERALLLELARARAGFVAVLR
ncbi:protease PrsW [Vallicoccus soli]|uniref:Protease PrsW n=1 Tax=Vallicoccus soli TaxID=2339232 RepID=A0A3A3Z704_9ACTN|nr:protease PrsW [Vallicoccus soli]